MKVLLIRPGEEPELGELNGYDEMHDFVGGCIETVLYKDYVIVCNDEFLLNGSKYNVTFGLVQFFGNIFICKIGIVDGERDLVGLDEADLQSLLFNFYFRFCRRNCIKGDVNE